MPRLNIRKLPRPKGRTLIIGDVHGCLEELEAIVSAFKPTSKDHLIAVGDLVNGGPDSAGVLKFARAHSIYPVLGNHEMRLLDARQSKKTSGIRAKDARTLSQLKNGDWEWMATWPHVIRIPSINVIVVHGGFHPFKPWRKQKPDEITSIQVIDSKGQPTKRAEAPDGKPWGETWKGPEHVYYGHTPRPEVALTQYTTGLDTGCVYGYILSAISLPEREIYQIEAQRPYIDD
jgi:predicted phosphodiesterase